MQTASVDYMVPSANGAPRANGIWNAPAMRTAIRHGDIGVLRPCQEIHPNAALLKDEWIDMDEVVNRPNRDELVTVQDLLSRGLRYNLNNPMGQITHEYQDSSEVEAATLSMLSGTASEDDLVDHGLRGVPIPIVHKGFTLDERLLNAGRNKGQGIDTTNAEAARRAVNLQIDTLFMNGNFTYGGYTLYGYTTHPQRNTGALAAAWTAATGEQMFADVNSMVQALYADKVQGPFVLYIPSTYHQAIQADFKANSDKSIRQRILEIDGVEEIRTSFQLATNNVVLVAMRATRSMRLSGFCRLSFNGKRWAVRSIVSG